MAETLYLTPAGTPPLSPAQAPRKRKTITTVDTAEPDSLLPKKVPKSREPKKTNQTKSRNGEHIFNWIVELCGAVGGVILQTLTVDRLPYMQG